jgi:hypothetical protein
MNTSFGQLGVFSFGQERLMPAPQEQLQAINNTRSKDTDFVYKLTTEEIKKALEEEIGKRCCKSKKPIEEGHLGDCYSYNALEYTLETFNEKRSLACAYSACSPGQQLSALGSGVIPDPWSMACQPSGLYVNETRDVILPFTDIIQVASLTS